MTNATTYYLRERRATLSTGKQIVLYDVCKMLDGLAYRAFGPTDYASAKAWADARNKGK